MSFDRGDYELTFDFALTVWRIMKSDTGLAKRAIKIMDLCEDVIGQVSYRPMESKKEERKRRRKK